MGENRKRTGSVPFCGSSSFLLGIASFRLTLLVDFDSDLGAV
jgi:hypothetical protein